MCQTVEVYDQNQVKKMLELEESMNNIQELINTNKEELEKKVNDVKSEITNDLQ